MMKESVVIFSIITISSTPNSIQYIVQLLIIISSILETIFMINLPSIISEGINAELEYLNENKNKLSIINENNIHIIDNFYLQTLRRAIQVSIANSLYFYRIRLE